MQPLFSIVIPVFNVEQYLEKCLKSIQIQVDKCLSSIEIILVDDGSTDNSGLICDRYTGENENIISIHQDNKGLLAARRAGFKVANGEYIINLDSDDLLTEKAIEELTKVVNDIKPDVCFFNLSVMDEMGIRPYYEDVFTSDFGCSLTREQVLDAYFQAKIPIVTSMAGKVFKRCCIDNNINYEAFGKLSMGEDTLQTAEIISNASTFYYLNKNLYLYRMGSGMTSKFDPNYYSTFRDIIKAAYNREGFANAEKYKKLYHRSILCAGCRAITQSKVDRNMRYADRRAFIQSIEKDKDFVLALREYRSFRNNVKWKYRIIISLMQIKAYYVLHCLLKKDESL